MEAGTKEEKEVEIITVDVDQVISRLWSIVGSGKYVEQLLGKVLINLVNIGGQRSFIEMFGIFFSLDKDLDDPCKVSYELCYIHHSTNCLTNPFCYQLACSQYNQLMTDMYTCIHCVYSSVMQ